MGIVKIRQMREIQPRYSNHPSGDGNEFKRKRQTSLLSLEGVCEPPFSRCPICYFDASTASYLARCAVPGKHAYFL
jgi:hypothetical protein